MKSKLEVKNLYKIYGAHPEMALELVAKGVSPDKIREQTGQVAAVMDVSFAVREGEIFTIMGLSGSGKSTLVRCLNRLIEPTRGQVFLDDTDIIDLPRTELRKVRRHKIAMVFQNFALLPHKTVAENVQFGLSIRGESTRACTQTAHKVLEQVGLAGWADRYPDDLSGGMKQRVGLARSLASDPDVLLMDEPFSALDPLIRDELQQELLKLQREIRKTIVFITHDFNEAVKLSDHLAVMRDGRFVQVGTPQEIVFQPTNDYVRNFSREMDRGKVLTAGLLAENTALISVAAEGTVEATINRLRQAGRTHAAVLTPSGEPDRYVSARELMTQPAQRTVGSCLTHELTAPLAAGRIIADAYGSFTGEVPVPVTDRDGRLIGLLTAEDVLSALSGEAGPSPTSNLPILQESQP